jgi:hypothetical protein
MSEIALILHTYLSVVKGKYLPRRWDNAMEGAFEAPSRDHVEHVTHCGGKGNSALSDRAMEGSLAYRCTRTHFL